MMRLTDCMTYVEAAKVLGISRQRIHQLAAAGRLATVRQGGRVFIAGWSVDLYAVTRGQGRRGEGDASQ